MSVPATRRVCRGTYEVPKALCSSGFGPTATLDEMELLSHQHTDVGRWAKKVLARENDKMLDELLGDDKMLPRGVLASGCSHEVVEALVNSRGEIWKGDGWQPSEATAETVELAESDVAFIARAFLDGESAVVLASTLPLAFLDAPLVAATESELEPEAPAGDSEPPEGAVVVAIVDSLDKNAVLELLAVAPGPKVLRRHAGAWQDDPGWLEILKSVKPPTMVKLEQAQVASIASQVDQSTEGVAFEALKSNERKKYVPIRASSSPYVEELRAEATERAIALNLGLVAVAGKQLSPKDYANTEKLRRYWLYGKGAAKIRWGTPGAWRRCYRNVVKYMGPKMAPGYCTNLSQRLGGPGVATHVGSKRGR